MFRFLDPLLPVCRLVWVTMTQSLSLLICTDINPSLAVKRYNKVPGTVLGAITVAIIIIMPILESSQFLFQSYFLKKLTELPFVLVIWKT